MKETKEGESGSTVTFTGEVPEKSPGFLGTEVGQFRFQPGADGRRKGGVVIPLSA